jgi:threonyl-tRNA synthetase
VLIESGINYVEVANEAAFYGPKIDVQVWRCLHTATTSAANSPSPPSPSRTGRDFAVPAGGRP